MSESILAVDDEPDMLVLLERIIREKTPYEVVTTNNALEIPRLLAQHRFDLIITDLSMPKLDGLDVLRLVRGKERDELVILITAFGDYQSSEQARELGVFDYIHKPFRKEQILTTVERALARQRERRASE
ncbi:MAG: Transcriptional regulatory protein OmpR [Calditrichaeota bacterium]|nr:Transcriptional regulatory protein OmpR [Calditrichota bacterium]